jgi:hypothetical protein
MARTYKISHELTSEHFRKFDEYLSSDTKSLKVVAKELGISQSRFTQDLKKAYKLGYLHLSGSENTVLPKIVSERLSAISLNKRFVDAYIVDKCIDDLAFAWSAAERVLNRLGELLSANDEVNIGLVSGSTTAQMIEQLVAGPLWDVTMHNRTIKAKRVNVLAVNITPLLGWDLAYNANNTILQLAVLLRDRLPGCEVKPYGLGSTLVARESERAQSDQDLANRRVLEYADPTRLGRTEPSKLNLVITGVGCPESSVFSQVLEDADLEAYDPNNRDHALVGDVAFSPVNEAGCELCLRKMDGGSHVRPGAKAPGVRGKQSAHPLPSAKASEKYFLYSALRLDAMRRLVEAGERVILIARNRRIGKQVDKTKSILAAAKGGYYNELITDAATAEALRK